MGVCLSKYRFGLGFLRRRSDRPPHISLLSPEFAASVMAPTSHWRTEPRLFLGNNSGYRVSYWVIQEDKQRTSAHQERIASSVSLHLNLGHTGGSLSGDVKRGKEETIETEAMGVYFLMRDHRMGPNGSSQPTQVPFPANCEQVRVYGFFEEEDGQWQRYKDKVYSIGRGKRSFILNALDSNIAPYAKKAGPSNGR